MRIRNILINICVVITILNANAQNSISDEGVEINGFIWATSNVGATNPEDYGSFYTWEEAQNACPAGWILPTFAALERLANTNSEWTTVNGKNGQRIGSGDNTLFLPATGMHGTDGSVTHVGSHGLYWGNRSTKISYMWFLYIDNDGVGPVEFNTQLFKMSVRCVKK